MICTLQNMLRFMKFFPGSATAKLHITLFILLLTIRISKLSYMLSQHSELASTMTQKMWVGYSKMIAMATIVAYILWLLHYLLHSRCHGGICWGGNCGNPSVFMGSCSAHFLQNYRTHLQNGTHRYHLTISALVVIATGNYWQHS